METNQTHEATTDQDIEDAIGAMVDSIEAASEAAFDADPDGVVDMTGWPAYSFVVITSRGWAAGDSHEECLSKLRELGVHSGFRRNSTPYNLIGFTRPVKGLSVDLFGVRWTWADEVGDTVEVPFNGWGD